ncbi:hypothetical protein GW626_06200 [Peribacillus muralis]|nr:hypothetical protein [Peribacillus muralis]MCK1992778.1 hypothetical protein [Peribacillus muralis]MCK2013333.1 hypothetical protein [Peribacillus muralis]
MAPIAGEKRLKLDAMLVGGAQRSSVIGHIETELTKSNEYHLDDTCQAG